MDYLYVQVQIDANTELNLLVCFSQREVSMNYLYVQVQIDVNTELKLLLVLHLAKWMLFMDFPLTICKCIAIILPHLPIYTQSIC